MHIICTKATDDKPTEESLPLWSNAWGLAAIYALMVFIQYVSLGW